METQCKPWSIVLVPRPLTPFAAFAWYVISELLPLGGLVREKRFFRWVDSTHPRGALHSSHGVILNLNAKRKILEGEILKWLQCQLTLVNVPRDSNWKSTAVRDFVSQGNRYWGYAKLESWLTSLSRVQNPEVALGLSNAFFRKLVDERIDPRIETLNFPPLPILPPPIVLPEISSVLNVTIPVVKKRGAEDARTAHREVVDYTVKGLPEGKVFRLCGQHILLAVGGPPNSGKSSLVPSLLVEMRNIINSLRSRGGDWGGLDLTVDISSLDAATPVADSVILSRAKNRRGMKKLKREWTLDLAQEAVAESEAKLSKTNIILTDLPGRVTNITESLSPYITFGGIVTNDWEEEGRRWREFFEDIKAPILFQVKSSRAQSLVTTYNPGEQVMGRIYRLNRTVRAWDPFIRTLADILLFDILPTRIGRPQNRLIARREPEDDQVTQ